MAIANFDAWRADLLETGRLPQSCDPEHVWDNAVAQVGQYIALLEMARDTYEQRVFDALLDSMQVEEDNEVYETTIGLLLSFPPKEFGRYLASAFVRFMERDTERAGDLLSLLVNNSRRDDSQLKEFKRELRLLPEKAKTSIAIFVSSQERDGWLSEKPGWYDDAFGR